MSPLLYVVFALLILALSAVGYLLQQNLKGIKETRVTNKELRVSVTRLDKTLGIISETFSESKRVTEKRLDAHATKIQQNEIGIAMLKTLRN